MADALVLLALLVASSAVSFATEEASMITGQCPHCGIAVSHISPQTPLCPQCGFNVLGAVSFQAPQFVPQAPQNLPRFQPTNVMTYGYQVPNQSFPSLSLPQFGYGYSGYGLPMQNEAPAKTKGAGWTAVVIILLVLLTIAVIIFVGVVSNAAGSSSASYSSSSKPSGSTFAASSITNKSDVSNIDASTLGGTCLITGMLRNSTSKADQFVVFFGLYDSYGNRLGTAIGVTEGEYVPVSGRGEFGCIGTPSRIDFPLTKADTYDVIKAMGDLVDDGPYFSAAYRVDQYSFIGAVSMDYLME